ncbi:hypothetical protein [Nocardioides jishulii]|uniref:Fibronectin type-III domain-containing protein n=1 Tax=Nocardioides jishulii TaxID=2575440 RepID=A0A4U2YJP8_9ACTN|nr:hypothetical protein [Nocardioides jishulii]QCX26885.1 hypothetical protein FCL41_04550 [Nocardioides jishulii]TKI61368.1 hypothetical protein FC770_11185 [Nocardioides jishulii]
MKNTLRRGRWRVAPAVALLVLSALAGTTLASASAAVPLPTTAPVPTVAPVAAAAPSASTTSGALPTTGTTKTLVLRAHWTQPDSLTKEQAEKVFTEANSWFREVSYGALGISGEVTDWLKIQGPAAGKCYSDGKSILTQAKAAAQAQGKDLASFQSFVVYFPKVTSGDCSSYPGWGSANGVWLNGQMDLPVVAHELGHAYGLGHSDALLCTGAIDDSCTYKGYGDDYDTMGRADETPHYSAPQKDKLGWLGNGRQVDLTKGGVVTLRPMASQTSGVRAAKVSAGGRTYWVEYRQKVGYDSKMRPAGYAGVQVRFTGLGAHSDAAMLIDPTPGTQPSVATATLGGGEVWTSPDGFTLSVGAATEQGAVIEVGRPPTVEALQVARVASGSARITGTAELSAASRATLSIRYGTTASYGKTTAARSITGAHQGDGTYQAAVGETLTGLTPGATYHYSVTVTTPFGSVSSANQTFTAPGAAAVPGPPAIANLKAGPHGDGAVLLFGKARLFTATSGTQTVRYGPTSSYGTTTLSQPVTVQSDINGDHTASVGGVISGLAPGVYHYSVTVTTSFGSVSSPDQTFTVAGPPTIETVGTVPLGAGSVTVMGMSKFFTAPSATQTIRYGTTSSYAQTVTRTVAGTKQSNGLYTAVIGDTLSSLKAGTTYHYSVTLTTPHGTVTSPDKTFRP